MLIKAIIVVVVVVVITIITIPTMKAPCGRRRPDFDPPPNAQRARQEPRGPRRSAAIERYRDIGRSAAIDLSIYLSTYLSIYIYLSLSLYIYIYIGTESRPRPRSPAAATPSPAGAARPRRAPRKRLHLPYIEKVLRPTGVWYCDRRLYLSKHRLGTESKGDLGAYCIL